VFVSLTVLYLLYTGNDKSHIEGLFMAAINAFGLLFVIVFMGHGLMEIPRRLWRYSDKRKLLRRLEFAAPSAREELVEADYELRQVCSVHSNNI
jgi:hypothetical protein